MQIYTIPPNIRTLIKKKSKKLAGIKPFAYFYPNYDDPAADDLWQVFEGAFRSWFALDNLCEEKIEALGDRAYAILQGYHGGLLRDTRPVAGSQRL